VLQRATRVWALYFHQNLDQFCFSQPYLGPFEKSRLLFPVSAVFNNETIAFQWASFYNKAANKTKRLEGKYNA